MYMLRSTLMTPFQLLCSSLGLRFKLSSALKTVFSFDGQNFVVLANFVAFYILNSLFDQISVLHTLILRILEQGFFDRKF